MALVLCSRDDADGLALGLALGIEALDRVVEIVVEGSVAAVLAAPASAGARFAMDEHEPIRLDFDALADLLLALHFEQVAQIVSQYDQIMIAEVFPAQFVLGRKP